MFLQNSFLQALQSFVHDFRHFNSNGRSGALVERNLGELLFCLVHVPQHHRAEHHVVGEQRRSSMGQQTLRHVSIKL